MLFASIDRSSQRHRVTGHWRRPSLSPCLSSLSRLSLLSLSHPHPPQLTLSAPFSRSPPLSISLSIPPRSVSFCVFGPELSEFHFRPITIHPRFKAAVTPRSFRKRAAARSNHFFSLHFVSLRLFNPVILCPSSSSLPVY